MGWDMGWDGNMVTVPIEQIILNRTPTEKGKRKLRRRPLAIAGGARYY